MLTDQESWIGHFDNDKPYPAGQGRRMREQAPARIAGSVLGPYTAGELAILLR